MRLSAKLKFLPIAMLATFTAFSAAAVAEEIGHVDTAFKLLGRNHQVTVEAFDDPKVSGVTCFISMARKGGLTGTLGIAEETSDASIACRQVGPIAFVEAIEGDDEGEEVFKKRQSIFFKRLNVVRFLDPKRNTLVYLAYSDKLIDGSPQNSVSAVAMMPWGDRPLARVLIK
ncbi:MAG: CreA protein [Paracoccaceae bacterium]